MSAAFIIGNGKSRLAVNLDLLTPLGTTYGCNWLFKEYTPNVLVATDRNIADHIQESGYAKTNRFHTRKPILELGGKSLHAVYKGFSSGPNCAAMACIDGHSDIYLIGMDLGTTNGMFNNVYADWQFYKKTLDPPTFAGNWVNQLVQLITEDYKDRQFYRIEGPESAFIKQFNKIDNLQILTMDKFLEKINIARGPL